MTVKERVMLILDPLLILNLLITDFDYLVDERQTTGVTDYLHSPMSDGTIEEDFEEALAREIEANSMLDDIHSPSKFFCGSFQTSPCLFILLNFLDYLKLQGTQFDTEDFSDIARYGIVEVVGDDVAGRKIIVISACK